MFNQLFSNIRFYILIFASLLISLIIIFVTTTIASPQLQIIRINQFAGFASVIFLYLALLPTPLYKAFPSLPGKTRITKARRAIGVAAFFFAFIHSGVAFFGQLGGFAGLPFLTDRYQLALFLGALALQIMLLLTLTSFDKIIAKMTFPKWKLLHRFIYIAGVATLIHVLMLGTHFIDISSLIPQLFFALLAIMLLLEAVRFDMYVQKKLPLLPRFGITATLAIGFIFFSYLYSLLPQGAILPLGIHTQHMQSTQSLDQPNPALPRMPGMEGDRTLRYTVGFITPDRVSTNTNVPLRFAVYNAANGNKVVSYTRTYEKLAHLIIVDNTLTYFSHIHPELQENEFSIVTQFPNPGLYRLYMNYQPTGAIEQQAAFSFRAGLTPNDSVPFSEQLPDTNLSKTFGTYEVTLRLPNNLRADSLSRGEQKLAFTIRDASTKKPAKNLKPYLGAFGHLVMISQRTYDYLHVHPADFRTPAPEQNGGPTVEFLPMQITEPIKPGEYRVFAQFNPDGQLFTADFTIRIQ